MNVATPFSKCTYCEKTYAPAEALSHQARCSANTVTCDGCSLQMQAQTFLDHVGSCDKIVPSPETYSFVKKQPLPSKSPTIAAMFTSLVGRECASPGARLNHQATLLCVANSHSHDFYSRGGSHCTELVPFSPSKACIAMMSQEALRRPPVNAPDSYTHARPPESGFCQLCRKVVGDFVAHKCPLRHGKCPRCLATIDLRFADRHTAECLRQHYREIGWQTYTPSPTQQEKLFDNDLQIATVVEKLPPPTPLRPMGPLSIKSQGTANQVELNSQLPRELRLCVLCEKIVRKDQFFAHLDQCPANLRSCEFCMEGVALLDYDDHVTICQQNIRECYICKKYVQSAKLADHMLSCTQGGRTIQMFHGTDLESAKAILRNGFIPSVTGLLGPGVYLSRDVEKAKHYGPVVIEAVVQVGRVAVIDKPGHRLQKTWFSAGYDAAWIPPLSGVGKSGLEEHCIYEAKRIGVKGLTSAPQEGGKRNASLLWSNVAHSLKAKRTGGIEPCPSTS